MEMAVFQLPLMRILVLLALASAPVFAQTLQKAEIYEISEMTGQQIYYASHLKPEALKDSKKIDDEDRAALLGAMGKTGIAMPRLKQPHIDSEVKMQPSKLTVLTAKMDDGEVKTIGRLEYKGGQDNYMVMETEDTITCILIAEGVVQVYTIHRNVTFPDGEKLITCMTTRNRPLGVTTICVNGKAKRVK